jgi:hypothetical protein
VTECHGFAALWSLRFSVDLSYIVGLRSFRTLNNFELHILSLVQSAITLANDCQVMDEDIRAIFAPDETVPFELLNHFKVPRKIPAPQGG